MEFSRSATSLLTTVELNQIEEKVFNRSFFSPTFLIIYPILNKKLYISQEKVGIYYIYIYGQQNENSFNKSGKGGREQGGGGGQGSGYWSVDENRRRRHDSSYYGLFPFQFAIGGGENHRRSMVI